MSNKSSNRTATEVSPPPEVKRPTRAIDARHMELIEVISDLPAPEASIGSGRIDIALERRHNNALALLVRGLAARGACTANGRFVTSKQHALCWLLEHV